MTAERRGLEANLRAECNQARIRPEPCRDVVAERRTAHVRNRVGEIVVIPYVEEIAAQLKLPVLLKGDLLHHAEIPVLKRGAAKCVASKISAARHRIREWPSVRTQRGHNYSGSIDRCAESAEVSRNRILGNDSIRVVIGTPGKRVQ